MPGPWGRAMSAWPDPNLAGKFKLERQKRGAAKEVKLVDADDDLAGIPKSREQKHAAQPSPPPETGSHSRSALNSRGAPGPQAAQNLGQTGKHSSRRLAKLLPT